MPARAPAAASLLTLLIATAGSVSTSCADVIWQRTHASAIYTTTAIDGVDLSLSAGTYANAPKQVELIPLEGTGVPDWTFPGSYVEVGAAQSADVIASISAVDADSTVTVRKWHASSSTPDWSYVIHACEHAVYRSIAVSADGARIAVIVSKRVATPFCRLFVFDATTGVPVTVDAASGTFARNVSISAGGGYVAFRAGTYVYVITAATGAVRWSENFLFSSDQVSLSGTGEYLAYGSTGLFVRRWNGSEYELSWALFDPSYSLSTCTVSADGGTLAAGWYLPPFPFAEVKVTLFNTPSSTPLWTYPYPAGGGPYQEYVADIAVSPDGGLIAAGSYGDSLNTNPEVLLFQWGSSMPVLKVDTPGSIFDVDLLPLVGGGAYIAACGKHVHANVLGSGGDLYSISFTPTAVDDATSSRDPAWRLDAYPNPAASTVIRFALPELGPAQLGVYSPSGELLRTLREGVFGRGVQTVAWDGMRESGRRAGPGVYFVRLESARRAIVKRVVLLR